MEQLEVALPTEILLKIFRRLHPSVLHESISLVCRQWRAIIGHYKEDLGLKSLAYVTNEESGTDTMRMTIHNFSLMQYPLYSRIKRIYELPWRMCAELQNIEFPMDNLHRAKLYLQSCPEQAWILKVANFDAFAEFRLPSKKRTDERIACIDIHTYTKKNRKWGKQLVAAHAEEALLAHESAVKLCGEQDALYALKLKEQKVALNECTSPAKKKKEEPDVNEYLPPPKYTFLPEPRNNQDVQRELKELKDEPLSFCSIGCVAEDDLYHCQATIIGAPDSPYEGGTFVLKVDFPQDYPYRAPRITFTTPIYHPNISERGTIYLPALISQWTTNLSISDALHWIYLLMTAPNPHDPMRVDVCLLYKTDRREYNRLARECTHKHAMG